MAFITCFNILTSFGILMVFLPFQLEAYYTTSTGCHHNGTWYGDKSLVPTTEKCLNCQCNKKTLVCRLKVCPEMPMPPPRGCVVVQKKNTCCPYLSCARLDAFYKIPATRRIIAYLDHYERESIDRVVNENMLQRRSDDTEVDLYVCVKNGTVYKSGSAMSSSNLCSYCYCIGGTEKCVKPKCMLPVEGCKPIFVDSTCCPVRYDCSTKQTGKSSQEVRYRKTSNKHYMRMSQRLQRNHGCTVGQQFYTEGQKMKTDKDKPCDICFCIRGQRKCAPKKCAPALRNCIPVVPKGQCCPSSYDCGSQRDYRRSQNSRQFNLFSLLFGKDDEQDENASAEIPVLYPHDREPIDLNPTKYKDSTTEKSIYDTIREGLEFIDNNNNKVLKNNMELVDAAVPQAQLVQQKHTPTPIALEVDSVSSATEVSLLDLLLGPSPPNLQKGTDNSSEENESVEEQTTATSTGLHWVDFLLGPYEEDSKKSDSTVSHQTNNDDEMEFDSTTSFVDTEDNSVELKAEQQDFLITSTEDVTTTIDPITTDESTQTAPTTLSETTEQMNFTKPLSTEFLITSKKPLIPTSATTTTITSTTKPALLTSTTTKKPSKSTVVLSKYPLLTNISKNDTLANPEKNSDFLAQLLDGLTGILRRDNRTEFSTQQSTTYNQYFNKTFTIKPPMHRPLPIFKPLPQDKSYTRINSKIANLTVRPPIISTKDITKATFKPLHIKDATKPSATFKLNSNNVTATNLTVVAITKSGDTSTSTATSTAPIDMPTSSTLKPLVIKTNPTILESEPFDQNLEPTLPPSLPNLKIIPFLPTDAVKTDHKQGSYEFYHHSAAPISRIDYDLYDDANIYPSITETYPLYPELEDGSKAEYIYKFNVEGPHSLVSSNAGKFDGTLGSPAFLKYDFAVTGDGTPSSTKGFSPPTKTEGGFVPKEPLISDDDNVSVKVADSYHVTQHIIDITTSADNLHTTKVIEITTPDPFKDVIRTEPPPDLTSLIEDKLKNFLRKSNVTAMTGTTKTDLSYNKPQNETEIEVHLKQPFTLNSTTQIEMTPTHIGNNNENNRTQSEIKYTMQQNIAAQILGDDMNDDVNDVSTIPPFKSLPVAEKLLQKHTDIASKGSTKSDINKKLTQMETTDSTTTMPTIKLTTLTRTNRPDVATTFKVNSKKTIAKTTLPQRQQKPTKTTKNSTLNDNEKINTSASSTTSSYLPISAVYVSRRVASTKPTKHYKLTTNPMLTTPITKSTPKPNAINIVATRRTQKPTTNANMQPITLANATSVTNRKTTTTKSPISTTMRTKTFSSPSSSSSSFSSLLQRVPPPSTNPFFMSPFDKLPFMDASFEVKRNSATPPTTRTTSEQQQQQHFAVQANIADVVTTDNEDIHSKPDADDALTSSRHKLMGLVNYKHTLNQLEGLEPSTQQRPQHSSTTSQMVSSSSSTALQQQQQQSSSPSLNNLIDPTGILKLAGCNIYGRMYRVGRIILELSSPCLECKCTEIGVKCGPLNC